MLKRQTRLRAIYNDAVSFTASFVVSPIVLLSACLNRPGTDLYPPDTDLRPPKPVLEKQSLSHISNKRDLQLQSRLVQLPGELRNRIYAEFITARDEIHIISMNSNVISVKCTASTDYDGKLQGDHMWMQCYRQGYNATGKEPGDIGILGFIRSCPQLSVSISLSKYCTSMALILTRYTEVVHLLYSRPTFIFQDYTSFLVFCATLPSGHFHSIQSIRFIQTMPSYHGDSVDKNFPRRSTYRALREYNVTIRNTELPTLEQTNPTDAWQHCCQILASMRGLKALRVDANAAAEDLHIYLGGSPTFWSDRRPLRN